jgi:ATP-binding cassette subfamily B protein
MPLIALCAKYFSRKMHKMYRTVQGAFADMTEVVRERYSGIRIVKAYNLEEDSERRMEESSKTIIRQNLALVKITGSFFPLMILFTNLSLAAVIFLGGRQTITADITSGDFVAFINYLNLMTWPMMALGWVTNLIQRGAASLDRIDKILKTPPEIKQPDKTVSEMQREGGIRFEDVSYSYGSGSSPALSKIGFEIAEGQTLGIVGPPGCGKTTLLNLLPRLYDVEEGAIQIGGNDIRSIKLEDLRDRISFVAQEPFLFSGTVRDNLLFGNPGADEEKLVKASEMAVFHDEILELPHGYQTVVGEKGVILSGGQKQRLALARAFVRKASILLLDDPVSQVDMDTGSAISDTIRSLAGRKTIFIASHRLSALRHADRILVMDKGVIRNSGTHEQLMKGDDYYSRTFRLQEMEETQNAFSTQPIQ